MTQMPTDLKTVIAGYVVALAGAVALLPLTLAAMRDGGRVLWSWAWFALFGAAAALLAMRSRRAIWDYAAGHLSLKRRLPVAVLVLGPVLVAVAAILVVAWAILN